MRHVLAGLLVIAACHVAAAHSVERWTSDKVVGLYCELIDPVRVENYFLNRQGIFAFTIGTKSAFTAPLWYWRIRDGRLQLSDDDSIREQFTLLSMRHGILKVRKQSGEIAHFRYRFEHKRI